MRVATRKVRAKESRQGKRQGRHGRWKRLLHRNLLQVRKTRTHEDEDVWTVGQIEVQKNRGSWQAGNQFAAFAIDDEDEIPVMAVEHVDRTRDSAIEFNVAEVRKPLASAVRMVMAGNRVVLDSDDSYIENRKTRERMKLKAKDGTYVFDVQYKDEEGTNSLLSHARREDIPMMPHETAYACVPPTSRTWAARSCSSAE